MIPLGGEGAIPARRSAEVDGLRAVLDPELEIAEPAHETQNPNQVSALDIDLSVVHRPDPPPPAAAASARVPRVVASARVARTQPGVSGSLKWFLLVAGVIAAALVLVLMAR
jgi:hypothetical protein